MCCIYLVTNKVNGKQYVGQTKFTMEKRRKCHESGVGCGKLIHWAIRKYGPDRFEWDEVCSDVPEEDLNRLEIECIAWYGTMVPMGYNLTAGGNSKLAPEFCQRISAKIKSLWKDPEYRDRLSQSHRGKFVSGATRAKLSIKSKGRWLDPVYRNKIVIANKGKKLSAGHIAKIRASNIGKKRTPEQIIRMSLARMGYICSEETKAKLRAHNKGRSTGPKSEECRRKISATLTGRKQSDETKAKRAESLRCYHRSKAIA